MGRSVPYLPFAASIPILRLAPFPFNQIPVNFIPQAGFLRRIDEALVVHLNVFHQPKFIGPTGWKHLIIIAVVHRHGDMQVGDIIERVPAVMDFALHAEGLGQVGNFHQWGDAAGHSHIAAQDIRGHLLDPLRHAIEAAGGIFGRQDRNIQFISELDVVINVFFHEGSSYQK